MTRKTQSQDKLKSQSQKCRLVHFKNPRTHSSAPKEVPPPSKNAKHQRENRKEESPKSDIDDKRPENYENLLLFYLTKLKSLFSNNHPEPAARENSALRMNKLHYDNFPSRNQRASSVAHPYRYTSSNPPRPRDEDVHSKVYKVVSAALEYGFANNILEKKGDCFYLKSRHPRVVNRPATPGPRYCERCCNARRYSKPEDDFPASFSERHKPMSSYCERPLHHIEHGKIERNYRDRAHGPYFHRQDNNYGHQQPQEKLLKLESGGNLERVKTTFLHCPKCRELERSVRK